MGLRNFCVCAYIHGCVCCPHPHSHSCVSDKCEFSAVEKAGGGGHVDLVPLLEVGVRCEPVKQQKKCSLLVMLGGAIRMKVSLFPPRIVILGSQTSIHALVLCATTAAVLQMLGRALWNVHDSWPSGLYMGNQCRVHVATAAAGRERDYFNV